MPIGYNTNLVKPEVGGQDRQGASELFGQYSHVNLPDVKDKAGRMPLSQIKLLKADPIAQEAATEEIKREYSKYFVIRCMFLEKCEPVFG